MTDLLNQPAPDFKLLDQNGTERSLADYANGWLVLYFYPKDDTSGCTAEACAFRDEQTIIGQFGDAKVVGVSADSVASHKKFSDKNHLNFTILSDPTHAVVEAYGVWQPKKFMGREYLGIVRSTFIIDPTGTIVHIYPKVNPKDHTSQIIEDLQKLQNK